jgi:hypothetical protein
MKGGGAGASGLVILRRQEKETLMDMMALGCR